MSDVEAVLFDLDDTLCTYRRSSAEMLALAFDRVGVEPFFAVEEYFQRYTEFVEESDDVDDLRERCFASIAREYGRDPDLGRRLARTYAADRDHRAVDPLPGAQGALSWAGERYRTGLVTNGAPEMQRQKMSALGIDGHFETIVYAGHDTPPKPDPEPFHTALADLGVDPGRAVHVGNSPSSDVAGARAAGVRSVLVPWEGVDGDPDPEPDHLLDSLAEFPPWQG